MLPKQSVVYESNRKKAIIFMNLFCLFGFIYMVMTKFAIYSYGVNALDLCMYRTFVLTSVAYAISLLSSKSVRVASTAHKDLFYRSLFGTIGFTSMVFALKYVPLGIYSIVFNTAPFLASLIAWLILKEVPKKSELICMIIAFIGVVIIGTAK